MKDKRSTIAIWFWLATACLVHGQGTFQNLNFELATVPLSETPSPPGFPTVDIAIALPGWSAFISTNQASMVGYNSQTLDTSSVSLIRTNAALFNVSVIEGTFSVFFMGGYTRDFPGGNPIPTDTSLRQTGLVPATARSIQFKTSPYFPLSQGSVSLDGQALSAVLLQSTPQYNLYGADVTPFQGQTKELRFTIFASRNGGGGVGGVLDSIAFSNQPIPEPSAFSLFGLGALLLGRRFQSKQPDAA